MKKYLEIFRITFKMQIAFRFDVSVNMLLTVTKILFAYLLWGAIFGVHETVSGFTFQSMLSYYLISSFLTQIEMSDGVSREISDRIRGGTFSKYMVVPTSTQGYFLAQNAGAASFYLIFDFIAVVIWVILFRIRFVFVSDIKVILLALLMVLLGLTFMVQLNYFLGILTFKFENIDIFLMIKGNLITFATGAMIPLALLPDMVTGIMKLFPFYYVTYLPSMLLIGRNLEEGAAGIVILSVWTAAITLVNKFSYQRLRVRYDGVGI